MVKNVFLMLALMIGLSCYAEKKTCVVIYATQGQTAFAMKLRPTVSFTETDIKLVCGETEVLYPLTKGLKLSIEDKDIETSVMDVTDTSFTITSSDITARGCKSLSVYTHDGKKFATGKADSDGTTTISTSKFPRGTYIIKTDNKVFKITMR